MDAGQLAILKRKAQRGVPEPVPERIPVKGNIEQGGGVPSDTLHVEPSEGKIALTEQSVEEKEGKVVPSSSLSALAKEARRQEQRGSVQIGKETLPAPEVAASLTKGAESGNIGPVKPSKGAGEIPTGKTLQPEGKINGVSGKRYQKYGTSFDNQLIVIDKTGPITKTPLSGQVEKVEDLIDLLKGYRLRQARKRPNWKPSSRQTSIRNNKDK